MTEAGLKFDALPGAATPGLAGAAALDPMQARDTLVIVGDAATQAALAGAGFGQIIPAANMEPEALIQQVAQALAASGGPQRLILCGGGEVEAFVRPLSALDSELWRAEADGPALRRLRLVSLAATNRRQRLLKTAFDRSAAAALLLLLAPLLLLIAAAVRLDSAGPALFRQVRLGRNARPFVMLKFRSMSHARGDARADVLTARNDMRVTRVGALLRRSSLDELPQLFNVLRGEMSLVGPRPLPPGFHHRGVRFEDRIPRYHQRHRVTPGLTGLSQVNRLRGTPEDLAAALSLIGRRVEYDNYYIDNWSFFLDIQIIYKTIVNGCIVDGAY